MNVLDLSIRLVDKTREGRKDEELHAGSERGIDHGFALLHFL
jgi:hypothetical protein